MNHVIERLPVVVLNVHSRCNCRCAMCDIWKVSDSREMPLPFVQRHVESFAELGVETVALSGGEPLMHSGIFEMCALLRGRGIRVMLLTSGLLIERFADQIAAHVDEAIVSLDGPEPVHDAIRGIKGGFERIRAGVGKLRRRDPMFRIGARCTVQKTNHAHLWETLRAARDLGFDTISFLAVDLASTAFNRPVAWDEAQQSRFVLTPTEMGTLEQQIELLTERGAPTLADSADHLQRIVHRFRAYAGLTDHASPPCNAPWISTVIDVDGGVRPCFFHPPTGPADGGLIRAINSPAAIQFRSSLHVETNPVCRRCTCSLHRP